MGCSFVLCVVFLCGFLFGVFCMGFLLLFLNKR